MSLASLVAAPAFAQDHFEIQVYDSLVAEPLTPGVELHANVDPDRVAHFTLEPHLGLNGWLELGGYLQSALTPDGYQYGGAKLRLKAVLPFKVGDWLGLGANAEFSVVPARFEPNVYGAELRPIADARFGRFYASVNPIVGFDKDGAHFEPAVKLAVTAAEGLQLGAEAYDAESTQWLLAAVDYVSGRYSLNFGAGWSSTGANPYLVKLIVGVEL